MYFLSTKCSSCALNVALEHHMLLLSSICTFAHHIYLCAPYETLEHQSYLYSRAPPLYNHVCHVCNKIVFQVERAVLD